MPPMKRGGSFLSSNTFSYASRTIRMSRLDALASGVWQNSEVLRCEQSFETQTAPAPQDEVG